MTNRSQVPRCVNKGIAKPLSEKERAKSKRDMNFKKGKARKKRVDTGKKITKDKSHTPSKK